jgi:hypothetical protein
LAEKTRRAVVCTDHGPLHLHRDTKNFAAPQVFIKNKKTGDHLDAPSPARLYQV